MKEFRKTHFILGKDNEFKNDKKSLNSPLNGFHNKPQDRKSIAR